LPVDRVAAVTDAGADHQYVGRLGARQLAECGRDHRRRVTSQYLAVRDITRVAGLAGDGVPRVPEVVVVVGQRYDRMVAPGPDLGVRPSFLERGPDRLDDALDRVRALGRIAQVAEREGGVQFFKGEDRHVSLQG